jgi:hypothetical protein
MLRSDRMGRERGAFRDGLVSQDPETAAHARRDAAEDPGITVVAPYELLDESGNISAVAVAWVESFGSENGSVVAGLRSHRQAVQSAARRQGRLCSSSMKSPTRSTTVSCSSQRSTTGAGMAMPLTLPPGKRASSGPNDD